MSSALRQRPRAIATIPLKLVRIHESVWGICPVGGLGWGIFLFLTFLKINFQN
jgi:hypothetical protein